MDMRLSKHKISTRILNNILDELIEVKLNAQNKEAFRRQLISYRLSRLNNANMLTGVDIDKMIRTVTTERENEVALARAIKKVNKSLLAYHKELLKIQNKLR